MKFKEMPFEQKPTFEADKDGFVDFGEISRNLLNKQSQYGGDFVFGVRGCPNLTEGLRVVGEKTHYEGIKIHKDDINEFVKRYQDFQKE